MKKVLVTGGKTGLGQSICEHFDATSISRESGFDISKASDRQQIAEMSLNYDVFVNNAFDGPAHQHWADLGQVKLFRELCALWQEKEKFGDIVNISSIATQRSVKKYVDFELYRIPKIALDVASEKANERFYAGKYCFRTTLLRFGRLDTPKSRGRNSWTGHGHQLKSLVKLIDLALDLPPQECLDRVDLDINFHCSL